MPNPFLEKFKRPTYALGTEKFRHTNPLPDLISKLPSWRPSFSRHSLQLYATLLFGLILISSLIAGFVIVGRSAPKPPKLSKASSNSLYLYEAKNKDFSAKIGSKESTAPSVSFTVPSGTSASFNLIGSQSKTSEQKGNTVIYPAVFADTSVTYTPLPTGLKEEIILDKPVYKAEYSFNLVTTAHPRSITTDFYSPFFFDDKNNYQFHLEKPFAVDAKGKRTDDVSLSLRKSKTQKDSYQILITVSPEWLKAKDRAYPVTIDPTIVHDTAAEFATGVLNRVKDTQIVATGGTITTSGGYTIHTFNSSGTFSVNTGSGNAEVLVVAGGGGGGSGYGGIGGGGGGAGGYSYSSAYSIVPGSYTVTVGNGGAGSVGGANVNGTNGQNSVFDSITSIGGGGGGSYNSASANSGGSGGGATYALGIGTGTAGQGSNGGTGINTGSYAGGGGGGAGAVGNNGVSGTGGTGGVGLANSISGASVFYAGGGGGGTTSGTSAGGNGGGGAGAVSSTGAAGTPGTANTGGGGGSGAGSTGGGGGTGGAGGSGVVIIRYLTDSPSLQTNYQELPADPFTVGLWHMNESADNSCAGGKDVCDLSGFGNHGTFYGNAAFTTSSLLGPKATVYDGTGDSTCLGDVELTNGKQLTIEAWFKLSALTEYQAIVSKNSSTWAYALQGDTSAGILRFWVDNNDYTTDAQSNLSVADGKWHHAAGVYDGTLAVANTKLYIDGVLQTQTANQTIDIPNTADELCFGGYNAAGSGSINGTIDEVRISNIARTPEQIKADASRRPYSVYTSDVLDFTVPIGSWNPLLWTEQGVNTGDGETLKNSTSLVAQWNFNETSGTTADNAETTASRDLTLNNFASTGSQDAAAGSGWTGDNKRWGAGGVILSSVATADSLSVADPAGNGLDPNSADITIETWVNTTDVSSEIFSNNNNNGTACTNNGYRLGIDASGYPTFYLDTNGATAGCDAQITTSNKPINDGKWHFVAVSVIRGTGAYLYVDGVLTGSDTSVTSYSGITVTGTVYMGGSAGGYDGLLDSTRVYSRALSDAEIMNNYQAGNIELQTRVGADTTPDDGSWEAWKPTTSETVIDNLDNPLDIATPSATIYSGALIATSSATFPLAEGNAALKIQSGRVTSLTNVVALWHLDETSGTGAYLKDSTTNANDLTPTGSSVARGISNNGRFLNGTSDYISCTDANCGGTSKLDFAALSRFSFGAWFKTTTTGASNQTILSKKNNVTGTSAGYAISLSTSNNLVCSIADGTNEAIYTSTGTYSDGIWHQVICTSDASTLRLYVDGVVVGTASMAAVTGTFDNSLEFRIGARSNVTPASYFTGNIDEVSVSNITRSAEQIAETYRAGRDHYFNKVVSSTDLSGKTSLPFFVAADRPGTYLTATVGESAFANYLPDTNTRGLWHLDEQSGTGGYLKDVSGLGNVLTPTGTSFIQGKVGKSRYFNGSSDYLTCTDANCGGTSKLDPISTNGWSFGAWVNAASFPGTAPVIMAKVGSNSGPTLMVNTSGQIRGEMGLSGCANDSGLGYQAAATITSGSWNYIVVTVSAANPGVLKIYLNGQLRYTSAAAAYYCDQTGNFYIGANGVAGYYWNGAIDEPFVTAATLSPTEIRQAYEYGLRTHPITIDFASAISHSNTLSSSADLSFALMATPSGYTNAGDNIYKGDKIIVRENYNGTEYIAQGTVDSVNVSTGTTTVSSWDASSTFPSVGFSPNAQVFKWQREYWNLDGEAPDNSLDAITNLTLRLTDGNEGRTVWLDDLRSSSGNLTTPTGSTITSSVGYRYGQYRVVNMSTDEAVSPSVSAVTLDYVLNVVPNTPTLDLPTDASFVSSLTPVLKTTATDTNSDYLRYKIQLCTDLAMTTACQTFDQTSSQTGWSGQDTQTSTAYASGTQATYTIQTPLAANTTYYWRSYAIDPAGVNSFSATQGTPFSFITNSPPAIPTLDLPADAAVSQTLSPILKTTTTDTNSDYLRYKIELCTDVGMTANCQTFNQVSSQTGWSGQNTQSSTAYTSGTQGVYTIQTPLSPDVTYYWRSYAIDPAGSNTFGSTQVTPYSFTTNGSPNIPTLDLPANFTTGTLLSPVLKTTALDIDSDYVRYKIQLCTDVGMTANCQTFNQVSSQTGWSGQDAQTGTAYASNTQGIYTVQTPLTANTTYYWRSYAIDPAGTNAFGATQAAPISFTTNVIPTVPSLDLPADNATGVSVTPILKTTGTDIDTDYLRYKIKICTNLNMSLNCQTFDQTSSQTGWSGQDSQTGTAYATGTQAIYTVQSALLANTQYFWYAYAIDPAGTNAFGSAANTPKSFTTLGSPTQASTCTVQKNNTNTQMILHWTDNSSSEEGYQVWKVTDGGAPVHLTPDLAANTVSYTDTSVTTGHTYGYLIRSFSYDGANTLYSTWCPTATSSLSTGGFRIF